MYHVKLEQFEGPLDLLLKLCQEQRLEINKISLATIADQYLEEIAGERIKTIAPGELADFLLVASQLLFIKSKILLPFLTSDEEEEGGDLEERLKVYRQYLERASWIRGRLLKNKFSFFREGLPRGAKALLSKKAVFVFSQGITVDLLAAIFKKLIANLEKVQQKLPGEAVRRIITLEAKIKSLKELLEGASSVHFQEALKGASSRSEIVVAFLAVLELVKQRYCSIEQEEFWGEIIIRKDNTNRQSPTNNTNIGEISGANESEPIRAIL